MNFNLTDSQRSIQDKVRAFAINEIRPQLHEMEKEDRFPRDVWKAMKTRSLWGLPYPPIYGGSGDGYVSYILAMEEISREGIAVGATLSVHTMAAATIFHYGTEEQKQTFLPPLLQGDHIGSFAFTEAATGSDPMAITTVATKEKGAFVLNGKKMFSSNSTLEGIAIVFAKDREKDDQISAFIIPKNSPGFTGGKSVRKMAMGGFETAPFSLSDVVIPEENVVGGEDNRGKGFEILLDMISIGKLGIAAQSLGIAEKALDEAAKYSSERIQRNKPIRMYPTIQALIAEMATDIEASKWMIYRAAFLREDGHSIALEGAMAKLFCTRAAKRVIDNALSVHGCYGYTKDFIVERLYREVKLGELYEGTHEMQKILIASKILWKK